MRGRVEQVRRLRARPVVHDFSEPGFVSSGRIVPPRAALSPLIVGITHNAFVGDIVGAFHMYRLPEAVPWLLVATGARRLQVMIVGPRTHVELDSLPPWTRAMEGVIFRAGALAAVLGLPLEELTDRTVDVESLWPVAGRALRHALEDAAGSDERLVILEQWLHELARAAAVDAPPLAVRIADALARRPVLPAAAELERIIGWSQRQLRRRCQRDLGLAPKRFLRLLRFTRVIDHLRLDLRPEWRALALGLGFADQAHLINEFRSFTGLAPTAFIADPSSVPALRHGAVPRPRRPVQAALDGHHGRGETR